MKDRNLRSGTPSDGGPNDETVSLVDSDPEAIPDEDGHDDASAVDDGEFGDGDEYYVGHDAMGWQINHSKGHHQLHGTSIPAHDGA